MALPNLKGTIPIRSKVRTGLKVNGSPKASDNFHCNDELFNELLNTPDSLTIRFPISDPEEALKTSLELWGANGTLRCWCADTITAHRLQPDNSVVEAPCKGADCGQFKGKKCNAIGRLKFEIPELGPGVFQLDTKSWNSIRSLYGALSLFNPIPPNQLFKLYMVKKKGPKGQFNVLHLVPIASAPTTPEEE